MGHVSRPRTTHTVEMSQLTELNARIRENELSITPSDLGLPGGSRSAVLVRLCWDGPPDFPYVHAHFAQTRSGHRVEGEHPTDRIVDLHTAALRELSRRLGVRQQWGT
jgi:hypothetical protein